MAEDVKNQTIDNVQQPAGADQVCPPANPGTLRDTNRRIEMLATSALTPYKRNTRTHSRKQIRKIAESIKRFGFNNPVLIDDCNQIVAGHGRVEAAKLLELVEVPTLRLSHMSGADARAYVIAENKLAEQAGWDREVEIILDDADEAKREVAGPEDYVPELSAKPISRAGDLWILGTHRVVCGDARDNAVYELLLDGEKAEIVIADAPYATASCWIPSWARGRP